MMMGEHKLSLLAHFDDLVRNTSVLTVGIESEFWRFVQGQEACRKLWVEATEEANRLRRHNQHLDGEVATLQTKLKHAREQIDYERKKRLHVEEERNSLERQVVLVRELLTDKNTTGILNDKDREKLAFLSSHIEASHVASPHRNLSVIEESRSILSDDDISYDKTGDDLETSYLRSGRKWKRPSAPPMDENTTPPEKKSRKDRRSRDRKHRRSRSAVIATTSVTVEQNGDIDVRGEISADKKRRLSGGQKLKKHRSTMDINEKNKENHDDSDDSYHFRQTPTQSILKDLITPESQHLTRQNSAGRGLNRLHTFVSKTVIKPETCMPCGKRVGFGKEALKCKDCRATAHRECRDQVPLPCVPTMSTPGTGKKTMGYLADYAPMDPPMIPSLIIHCVNEVESRGLGESGLYRLSGTEREVKELKEKFLRGKGVPNLCHVDDIHVVCGCVKDFLRSLKEPIVTYRLWHTFVNASMMRDHDESVSALYQAISELPQANRDTLAFMILHLQRVGESTECKMPQSNLAKVFGPTLIGYSTPEPEPMQIMSETGKQAKVMESLMELSSDYWTTYINIDLEDVTSTGRTPQTPEARRGMVQSMLGPINTPTEEEHEKKPWYTPRFGSKNRQAVSKKPTHFFQSPIV